MIPAPGNCWGTDPGERRAHQLRRARGRSSSSVVTCSGSRGKNGGIVRLVPTGSEWSKIDNKTGAEVKTMEQPLIACGAGGGLTARVRGLEALRNGTVCSMRWTQMWTPVLVVFLMEIL